MKTPAISSPLTLSPASASTNKQDVNSASDAGTFNQALSQATDRNNTNDVAKNSQNENAGSSDQSKNDSASASTTPTNTAKAKDDDKVASTADGKTDKTDKTDPASTLPSAELLAYVASLAQTHTAAPIAAPVAAPVTASVTTTVSDTTATGATLVTGATAKINSAIDTPINTAAPDTGATAATSEKDAVGKKPDFVAALDKATTAAGDSSQTPTTATAVKTDADLAAAAQTAKVLDTAKLSDPGTVSNPQITAAATATVLQHMNDTQTPQPTRLEPQVGSPGWDQALGQQVVWMVQGAQQSATLTLHPPELGPLQVTLNVSNSQATANFVAFQPEVRHALEAAMPRLREMLGDAGIQLGQSNVSAGSPNQQGSFGGQQSSGRQSGQAGNAANPVVHVSHIPVPTSSGTGIVDTFA